MAYTLILTEKDTDTIAFVGGRYGWSTALLHLNAGVNEIPEHAAWEICRQIEEDTEGGHSYFPMLDHRSELADKLIEFINRVV